MPSAHDALDGLIRAYPGGYEAIAQRLGKHPSTLRNEVHPPLGSSAKLGWDTAMQVMGMCQQVGLPAALAPLDAAELAFGRTAMWLPDRAEMEPGAFEALSRSALVCVGHSTLRCCSRDPSTEAATWHTPAPHHF